MGRMGARVVVVVMMFGCRVMEAVGMWCHGSVTKDEKEFVVKDSTGQVAWILLECLWGTSTVTERAWEMEGLNTERGLPEVLGNNKFPLGQMEWVAERRAVSCEGDLEGQGSSVCGGWE